MQRSKTPPYSITSSARVTILTPTVAQASVAVAV